MSKLGFWVAVSVVSLGAAVGAWYYKYQLYGWLPSTASSELKNVDGLLMDKEGKPFTGRVKDISDSGYSLYAYKDGKLDGLNVVFSEGQLREIGHWENGEQNGLFEAWTDKGVLVDGSVRISVSGEVIPGAAQRGCPLYLRCSMPDLMR